MHVGNANIINEPIESWNQWLSDKIMMKFSIFCTYFVVFFKLGLQHLTSYRIVCADTVDPKWEASIWNIMSKVRIEAMMWGAGTALGELPPYFMARASRLSGYDPNDEDDLKEFEELQRKRNNPESMVCLNVVTTVLKMEECPWFHYS